MSSHASGGTSPRRGVLLALTTALLWGTIPIAGKFALLAVTPLVLSFVRFTAAAFLMMGMLRVLHPEALDVLRQPPWKLGVLAALGLTGNYLLYFLGLNLTTATAAQLIIQLSSVFLVIWGVTLFKESLTPTRLAGTLAAVLGVLLVSWNGLSLPELLASKYLLGNVLIMAAAASWSFYAVAQKKLNETYTSYQVLLLVLILSALFTAIPAAPQLPATVQGFATATSWVPLAALVYLCFNTALAYGSFAESLKHVDASVTAVIVTFGPVVTMLLVIPMRVLAPEVFGGEVLTPFTLLGAALIIGGIVLVARERVDDASGGTPASTPSAPPPGE